MTAGWVAGTVRARGMARRVLGADAARQLAASRSLRAAQRMLEQTPFRAAADPGLHLGEAQHAVAGTILWDLRVLAGWLPREGVSTLRLLAGWFEIANVDELLQALAGRPAGSEFQLGALATAWPRLSQAGTTADLRRALAGSAWGDPGGDSSRDIRLAMRLRWAARVAASGDRARSWAASATAILGVRPPTPAASASGGPGANGRRQGIARLASAVRPRQAAPVRTEPPPDSPVPEPQPWRAEADWWRRVEREGRVLLRSSGSGNDLVLGAVAVMAADARRVQAALASAERGGQVEAYDAVV